VQYVIRIAEALNYNKLARLKQIESSKSEELMEIVQACSKETLTILFFPGMFCEIRHTSTNFHLFVTREQYSSLNYLISHPVLDEKFLRRVFTGLELLLYKLCHITLEAQDRDYSFEKQKTIARFNRLKAKIDVENWETYKKIFLEVMSSRDYFAHSFIDVNKIPYRGVALENCFGYSHLGRQPRNPHMQLDFSFVDDLKSLFGPLSMLFDKYQLEQLYQPPSGVTGKQG